MKVNNYRITPLLKFLKYARNQILIIIQTKLLLHDGILSIYTFANSFKSFATIFIIAFS